MSIANLNCFEASREVISKIRSNITSLENVFSDNKHIKMSPRLIQNETEEENCQLWLVFIDFDTNFEQPTPMAHVF
jgi:hypothetical protein